MKVLVTGATGFIGEQYVQHLTAKRPDVKVFFCGRNLERGSRLAAATGAHYFRGDLQDEPYVKLICKDMDVIVHCAGKTGLWGDYLDYYHANVVTTENLLAAAPHTGVQRFVNLGTPSVYFDFNDHLNVICIGELVAEVNQVLFSFKAKAVHSADDISILKPEKI